MAKRHQEMRNKSGDTRILFKKSNNTLHTYSRTCSGASQLTRSGVSHLKRKLSKHKEFYVEGGKIKRDLSIETDVCVLRRYCMRKRNKMSNKEASSAKSRYSNFTEIDTIDEFNPDDSACGDNEDTCDICNNKNPQLTVDVTALMIENFKDLLNNWIQTHLKDDSPTKRKIENIFHSVLHKIESKYVAQSSSCSTYILCDNDREQKVKDKKIDTYSFRGKRKLVELCIDSSSALLKKQSCFSIPITCKNCKIISTLSIPRNFYKRKLVTNKREKKSTFKAKKRKLRNLYLSKYDPNKMFPDCSSFDLLAVSIKSLIRRCANCEEKHGYAKNGEKVGRIVFLPEPNCKSAATTTSSLRQRPMQVDKRCKSIHNIKYENTNIVALPYLIDKQIYNKSENYMQIGKNSEAKCGRNSIIPNVKKDMETTCTHDDFTMTDTKVSEFVTANILIDKYVSSIQFASDREYTSCRTCIKTSQVLNEKDQSDPMITIDFIDQSLEFPHVSIPNKSNKSNHNNRNSINNNKKHILLGKRIKKRRKFTITKLSYLKFDKIQHKDFTYLFKKVSNNISQSNEFLKHFQDIFKYFANYDTDKNIKLDVHVNVFPMFGHDDDITNFGNDFSLHPCEIIKSPTMVYKVNTGDTNNTSVNELSEGSPSYCINYNPEIIPLLDGAASHSKYICTRKNSSTNDDKTKQLNSIDQCTMTLDYEITQEIAELKLAIKDLATTAESLIKNHLISKKKSKDKAEATTLCNFKYDGKITSTQYSERKPILPKHLKSSKGIQFSSGFIRNQRMLSGLKLKKLPKKSGSHLHTWESENQVLMKTTSYRIIDSESILKVTDMTSTANNINDDKSCMDQGLTCSLPRARSLYEVSTEKTKKTQNVLAYYCEDIKRKTGDNVLYCLSPYPAVDAKCKTSHKSKKILKSDCFKHCSILQAHPQHPYSCTMNHQCAQNKFLQQRYSQNPHPQHQCPQNHSLQHVCNKNSLSHHTNNSSYDASDSKVPLEGHSACLSIKCHNCNSIVDIDSCDKYRVISVKQRKQITCFEGFIYCTLMWIPILIIMTFFYIIVLKPKVQQVNKTKDIINSSSTNSTPKLTDFYRKLADLGF